MNFLLKITSLLGNGWTDAFEKNPEAKEDFGWVINLFKYLDPILYALMAVVGAAGVIYAVYLGINLARADDQTKRDEAKKRLIYTLIAVAVVVVLVIFFNELLPLIVAAVASPSALPDGSTFIHW